MTIPPAPVDQQGGPSNRWIRNGTIPVGSWEFAFAVDALDNQFQGTYLDKILVTSY